MDIRSNKDYLIIDLTTQLAYSVRAWRRIDLMQYASRISVVVACEGPGNVDLLLHIITLNSDWAITPTSIAN